MAKLLLLVVVIFIASNCPVNGQFGGGMFGAGDLIRDIGGEINHAIKRFSGPDERLVKDQYDKIAVIKKNIAANNKTLIENDKISEEILNQLGSLNESQRELDLRLINLGNTFNLVDLKIGSVMDRLNLITQQFSDIPVYLNSRSEILLDDFIKRLTDQDKLISAKIQFKEKVQIIDNLYKEFLDHTKPDEKWEFETLDNLFITMMSGSTNEIEDTLNYLSGLLNPGETGIFYDGFLKFLRNHQGNQTFQQRCDMEYSFQEQYRQIYKIVLNVEIRSFTMRAFAMHYLKIRGYEFEENVRGEIKLQIERVLKRISGYLGAMKAIMPEASRELYRCEIPNHPFESYFKLNDLFGLYYVNKYQLNPLARAARTERIISTSYIEEIAGISTSFVDLYRPRFQCNGKLHNCKDFTNINFCEARIGTNRRYSFAMGTKRYPTKPQDCNGRFIDTLAAYEGNILCQCSEEGARSLAARAINLNEQLSDIENNMVVTNVRFLKKNNMVHLQIEQGLLLPEGNIDMSTVLSKPVGNFRYLQNSSEGSYVFLNSEEWDDKIVTLKYDVNYTYLYHDRATFNLDDIVVPYGFVVTGVKLSTAIGAPADGSINKSPIQLMVHATAFDYDTGLLNPKIQKWFTPNDMTNTILRYRYMRNHIDVGNRDVSIKNTGEVVQYETNNAVTFKVTSWEDDLGQTVVPYFDAQAAAINNKVALDGVGIFYRGPKRGNFGGFIAPKIFTINHAHYIRPYISKEDIDKYKVAWY